jgi:hypothetical protein
MISVGLDGAEAALLLFDPFAFGAALAADFHAVVIAEGGLFHDAAAVGAFDPFGGVSGFIDPVTFGAPIAAAVAKALFSAQVFAALAADLGRDNRLFDEGVAAGLPVGAEILARIPAGRGFVRKTGAGTALIGSFRAKDAATIRTNQI